MQTYLMSYPTPRWRIRGGNNFRSELRAATNPRSALGEWLALADAITDAGGWVMVLPPPDDGDHTGMIYTANAGQLFAGRRFVVSRMQSRHRADEAPAIAAFARKLRLTVEQTTATWEGQAEICALPGNRFILSFGVRSDEASVDEIRRFLPAGAEVLTVRLRQPFFHGDTCLAALDTPKGGPVLLACPEALVDRSLYDLQQFARDVEVLPVDEADARAYACNALAVGERWLHPRGISTVLTSRLARRGLVPVELELAELFGKGGGGPRCLVNVLGTLPLPESLCLATQRRFLAEIKALYPQAA